MPSIVQPGADFISVLEALYQPEPDMTRWAVNLLTKVGDVVAASNGHGIWGVAHEDGYENPAMVFGAMSSSSLTHVIEAHKNGNHDLELPTGEVFRAIFYPGRPAVTHSEIESALTEKTSQEETRQRFRAYRALTSVPDALGIFAYPQPGLAVVLWVPFDRDLALSRFERHVLHRVSGHLDSAFRLRYHPDLAVASRAPSASASPGV